MEDLIKWLKGKKSYIIAIAIMVLGFLQGFGIFIVPEWTWAVLAALGLAFIRAGVNKVADTIRSP